MGDGTLIDVVLFAMVAAFLFLRLRSVLGRRTGQERQRPNPFVQRAPEQTPDQQPGARERSDVVLPLPIMRPEPTRPAPELKGGATPLATGLAEVTLADS